MDTVRRLGNQELVSAFDKIIACFLGTTDRMYRPRDNPAIGVNLYDVWRPHKSTPRYAIIKRLLELCSFSYSFDDCSLQGNKDNMLVPPADYTITVIESAEGLAEIAAHLQELNETDAVGVINRVTVYSYNLLQVALDTEGGGSPYSEECLQTIQLATTRRRAYVIDIQKCHKMPELRTVGDLLQQDTLLKFGKMNKENKQASSVTCYRSRFSRRMHRILG